MALAIASIPVLTGEVAEKFEAAAEKNYEKYLNRSEAEKREVAVRYMRGMELVKQVLAKSHIGNR